MFDDAIKSPKYIKDLAKIAGRGMMGLTGINMTIKYGDGRSVQAALLKLAGDLMRVAIQGADDVTEFQKINGVWVGEDCEPVKVEFAWQQTKRPHSQPVLEKDCCWTPDEAAGIYHAAVTSGMFEEVASSAWN